MPINLCRICLEDGATIHLFESIDSNDSILSKLKLCLNEKVEDIDDYPRKICNSCNEAIVSAYELIQKYKKSCTILQNKLKVKLERLHFSDDSCCEDNVEIEVEPDNIKREVSDDEISIHINDLENIKQESDHECYNPINNIKSNTLKVKKENTALKRRPTSKTANCTNRIASSILEGQFLWIGDTWCIKPTTSLAIKKQPVQKKNNQKRVTIKVKKIKTPNPPKLCDICGDIFQSQDKLWSHKHKIHFKETKKCPHCPRVLSSKYYLDRHLRRVHQTQKDFICAQCGKGFAFRGELSQHHKAVHNKHLIKKKKFACKICKKEYKCAKSVLVHERSVHTGDRPAICTICESSFYHEDYLKEHMRLHTGETPFKCPICGRGYAQRGNMKSHLRNHRVSDLTGDQLSKLKPSYLRFMKP